MPEPPAESLPPPALPGFYGKLPLAGDFVTRRLPPVFVRFWDRWTARNLVPRLADDAALFFLLAAAPGPMAGAVLPSADRSGRRFPLTLATIPPRTSATLPRTAATWFAALAGLGRAAAAGSLDPDTLDARLQALAFPPAPDGPPPPPLLLWTATRPSRSVDPAAPGPALDALFGPMPEAE